ncbi:MAG: hypothetical protein ABI743_02680 [bacterium]
MAAATKKKAGALDLFAPGAEGSTDTRVWEYPGQLDWSQAKAGDLIQFTAIRHWEAPGTDAIFMEAVGRLRHKGKTSDEKRYVQVEIIWDDEVPRLGPDLRTFLVE